jgi:hypothetical protein
MRFTLPRLVRRIPDNRLIRRRRRKIIAARRLPASSVAATLFRYG